MLLRSVLLAAGIAAIAYFEFACYPGHTYLAGESQNLVAMMERLHSPGFLSRDLVAVNPNLSYTIYDEVTLFLIRVTGHDFQWALAAQQLTFRLAGILGVFLLSLSAGLRSWPALLIGAVLGVGATLPGLNLAVTDLEPTPFAFALSLLLLAFGFLAQAKPLLAGFFAGLALVYQPTIGATFWLFVALGYIFESSLRPLLRATFPTFIVFTLLLANAAQLQPGSGEAHPLFQKVSSSWQSFQMQRTPELWISTWSCWSALLYLALGCAAFLSLRLLWPHLSVLLRWVFIAPIAMAIASVLLVLFGFEILKWAIIGELQLARTLALAFVVMLILCAAAGHRLWHTRRRPLAVLCFLPLLLSILFLRSPRLATAQQEENRSVAAIARWAQLNTWGGSMFLFPDAGKSLIPGYFRGLSMRAVYVDWIGGELGKTFPAFAIEWNQRWHEAGDLGHPVKNLPKLLHLPIDYVVLHRNHALSGYKPEIVTPAFVVYDAQVLSQRQSPQGTKSF